MLFCFPLWGSFTFQAEYRPEGSAPGTDGEPRVSYGKWSVHEVRRRPTESERGSQHNAPVRVSISCVAGDGFPLNSSVWPDQVPESEGGNAPYCSVQKGLNHCLTGVRSAGNLQEVRPLVDDSAWTVTTRAAVRDDWAPSLDTGTAGAALRVRPGTAAPQAPAGLQLRVMEPRSLLVVGKAAVVYERSFSGRVKARAGQPQLPCTQARCALHTEPLVAAATK